MRSSGPPPLRVGAVVHAPIVPDAGIVKSRRSIVLELNQPAPADAARCIGVVGVTSDNQRFDPADVATYPTLMYVAMPSAADGRCHTSFTLPCAAKANRVRRFRRDRLSDPVGFLRAAELDELVRRLKAFAASVRP